MRRGVLEFWWTCSRSTQKEKIEILPLWKAGFTGMPSNLWVSLECPYQRCPSRYNAISAHLTSSQNLQLIFLTWTDAYAPASISYPVPPLSHGTPVTPCFCTAPVPCSEEKIQHDYRTDKDRFIGKCMAPDCPWHINGRKQRDSNIVMVHSTYLLNNFCCLNVLDY